MTEAARSHLSLVDRTTGEVVEQDPATVELLRQQIVELEQELRTKRSAITRLKNENARLMGVEPEAETIIEVLTFHHELLTPKAPIVPGSDGWSCVRARLREQDVTTKRPAFTALALRAAAVGVSLSEWHVKNKKVAAKTVYKDASTVSEHIDRAVRFKRRTGVSGLTLVDELGGTALEWLADRCSCGGLLLEHLRSGPGALPCPERQCASFDFFAAKVNRHLAEAA